MLAKNGTLQMSIPQYLILILQLTPINTVSLNTVFSIPQNQCYPGNTCTRLDYKYPIVGSTSPSCFEAHVGLFRLLMKGIFDPYVL